MPPKETTPTPRSRREFLDLALKATAGAALFATVGKILAGVSEAEERGSSETTQMLGDLQRALRKAPEERRWGMVIDLRRCIGCHACTVACVAENNLPPGVTYRTVPEVEDGDFPDVKRIFMPTNCMQCDKPPCAEAANSLIPGAMSKQADGIVEIDYAKMKGKKVFEAAKKACPYTALYYDEGGNHTDATPAVQPYEKRSVSEYGKTWGRKQTRGNTRKCHFCTHRLEAGQLPACVSTCTGQAMHFGDLNDPESLVARLLRTNKATRMYTDRGTEPRLFYLSDEKKMDCMSCHSPG